MKLSFAGAPVAVLCVCVGLASGQADQTYSTLTPPGSSQQAYGSGLQPGSRYWSYQANNRTHFASFSEDEETAPPAEELGAAPTDDDAAMDKAHADQSPVAKSCANGSCGGYTVGGFGSGAAGALSKDFAYSSPSPSCGARHPCGSGHCLDATNYGLDTCARPSWFGGVYGLILDHDDDSRGTVLAVDDTATDLPILSTGMARMKVQGGAEVRVGRYLNNCWAVEGVYWGWYPDQVEANAYDAITAGNVISSLDFNDVTIGGNPVNNLFTNAQRMRLQRKFEAHNIELNFLRLPVGWGACGSCRSRIAMIAGIRYVKLLEDWRFSSDITDGTFDFNVDEAHYETSVENNMLGFQLGALLDHYFTCRLSGHIDGKMGVFGNRMNLHTCLKDGTQAIADIGGAGAFAGQQYAVDSKKEDVAFVGELRAGLAYDITPCWKATAGYRAVVLSGVALAESQIPTDFSDLGSVANINDHDAFILHGAYFGAEYNW